MKRYNILPWIGWTVLALLILVILGFIVMFVLFLGVPITRTSANPERYPAYQAVCDGAEKYMPTLSDCGSPEKLRLTQLSRGGIFPHDSVALFLRYDEEGYRQACEQIREQYSFYESPTKHFQEVRCEYAGYSMQAADLGLESRWSNECKSVLLIGFCEEKHAIVYAYCYDQDLDAIPSLTDYLWENISFPLFWRFG